MSFNLIILTPVGEAFNGSIDSVVAPGERGQFEVLTGHEPILYQLKAGPVRIRQNSTEIKYQISEGVFEVNHEHQCTILTELASDIKS